MMPYESPLPFQDDAPIEERARRVLADAARGPEQRAQLLSRLEDSLADPDRLSQTLSILHHIRRQGALSDSTPDSPFRVMRLELETGTLKETLDLLIVPSIFEPEDWGYTFLEGLLRRSPSEWRGKHLVELGTGSGWISLALLKMTPLSTAHGLDVNPIALRVARINAVLNSYDEQGRPLFDASRRLLHERFEVAMSNLLETPLKKRERADFVIGCIPQVLAPSPDLDPGEAVRKSDEEDLYDLSNYFVMQGVYEDQFGLGLLAKALDQAVFVMSEGGRVILNIAGRPGREVITRMFTRRGFLPHIVWTKRVQQAEDTDTAVLARLEEKTGNAFEFYLSRHSRESIGAVTAQAWRESGRELWHDLKVYEATLRFEGEMRPFFEAMRSLRFDGLVDQLDLSAISEEQIGFLRALASSFVSSKTAPYTHECGAPDLRALIASYLDESFDLRLRGDDVFVGPNRETMIRGLLTAFCEEDETILISSLVRTTYHQACADAKVRTIVANDDLMETAALIEQLSPKLVILALSREECRNRDALIRLLSLSRERSIPVLIDGSEHFDISSEPDHRPLFETLASQGLDGHVLVVVGLIHNKVYPDLRPAFVLGADDATTAALVAFAESTYSRNSTFVESYYRHLFEEILTFRIRRREARSTAQETRPIELPLSSRMKRPLNTKAFDTQRGPSTLPIIRLDYGENELPLPDRLVQGILLGFTNLRDEPPGRTLQELIAEFTQSLSGHRFRRREVRVGAGVFPLIADMARVVGQRLGRAPRVALPTPYYGYLPPLFLTAGCEVVFVPTKSDDGFLLCADTLRTLDPKPDIVFLGNPSNPNGLYYTQESLTQILSEVDRLDATLFVDEIFWPLDLSEESTPTPTFPPSDRFAHRVVLFNGLSKMFAAGGLRFGWCLTQNRDLILEAQKLQTVAPDRHALTACEVLLRGLMRSEGKAQPPVLSSLQAMREGLASRRQRFVTLLERAGAKLPEGRPGGLFVFPDMSPVHGRSVALPDGSKVTLTRDSLPTILRGGYGLQVNPGVWAGLEDHVRLCFSLRRDRFTHAVERFERFVDTLGPPDGSSRM